MEKENLILEVKPEISTKEIENEGTIIVNE